MAVEPTDSRTTDSESKAMLFEGASVSQLAVLFGIDKRTVASRLGVKIQPVGKRGGYPIYAVRDAAPLLVEQDLSLDDVEKLAAFIQQLDPSRLPRMLTKEFWQAMLNKQKYEEQAGDLWRTEKVLEVYSDLVKTVRMPLVLARDTVANQVELTPRIQAILNEIIDSILEELHDAVVERFRAATSAPAADDDL